MNDEREQGAGVSVIVCTYNPRGDLLAEVMGAIEGQSLKGFEVVVVDNGSSSEVVVTGEKVRVVREEKAGLNHARVRGINEAKGEVLVFVDDDNVLDGDYLEKAVEFARGEPGIGAFGGVTWGRFEDGRLPGWKMRLADKMGVRDHGVEVLRSMEDKWGPWEPIGAGMVVRRVVAEEFVRVMESSEHARRLDRSGEKGLMSGGDTLMARCAYRVGLGCAYAPGLKLTHVIKRGRFGMGYLLRILYGHGRSVVVLDRALGVRPRRMSLAGLVLRAGYRLVTRGVPGCIIYAWDMGYYREYRSGRV